MKITVRKRICPVCFPYCTIPSWVVSDESGAVLSCSWDWRPAMEAAFDIAHRLNRKATRHRGSGATTK